MPMRAIVYGCGKEYEKQRLFIEKEYDVIAVSDKNKAALSMFGNGIAPNEITNVNYDCIYVTTSKYYKEIRKELIETYGVPEEKIVSPFMVWWHVSDSDARDAWVIRELGLLHEGESILDAGAGNCKYKKYCDHLKYCSQDFGEYDDIDRKEGLIGKDKWQSKKCDIICDIANIPVDNNSFDNILCTEVLEHVKNPVIVINEFGRIIKRKGTLLLTAPFCSLTHMAPYYYSNGFSKYWYKECLKDAGFEIREISPIGNYFYYLAQELMRVPEMAKDYSIELSSEDANTIMEATRLMIREGKAEEKFDEVLCMGYLIRAQKA